MPDARLNLGIDPTSAKQGAREFEQAVDRGVTQPAKRAALAVRETEASFKSMARASTASLGESRAAFARLDAAGKQSALSSAVASRQFMSLAEAEKAMGSAARISGTGMGRLRLEVGSLAFQAAGLPGTIGRAATALGAASIGTLTTLGIFAGLAAVATAFNKITSRSREAKKAIDDFISSSKTLKDLKTQEAIAGARAELESLRNEEPRGNFITRIFGALFGPGMTTSEGLSQKQIERMHELSIRLRDYELQTPIFSQMTDRTAASQGRLADAIETTSKALADARFQRGFKMPQADADALDRKIKALTTSLVAMNAEAAKFGGVSGIRFLQAVLSGALVGAPNAGLLTGPQPVFGYRFDERGRRVPNWVPQGPISLPNPTPQVPTPPPLDIQMASRLRTWMYVNGGSLNNAAQGFNYMAGFMPGMAGQVMSGAGNVMAAAAAGGPVTAGIAAATTALGIFAQTIDKPSAALLHFQNAVEQATQGLQTQFQLLDISDPRKQFQMQLAKAQATLPGSQFGGVFKGLTIENIHQRIQEMYASGEWARLENWAKNMPSGLPGNPKERAQAELDFIKQLEAMADAAGNVVQELNRMAVAIPEAWPLAYWQQIAGGGNVSGTGSGYGGGGWGMGGPGGGPGGGKSYGIIINVNGATDPFTTAQAVVQAIGQIKAQGGTTALDYYYQPRQS